MRVSTASWNAERQEAHLMWWSDGRKHHRVKAKDVVGSRAAAERIAAYMKRYIESSKDPSDEDAFNKRRDRLAAFLLAENPAFACDLYDFL